MKEEIYFAVTFSKNPAKYITGNRALLFGVFFLNHFRPWDQPFLNNNNNNNNNNTNINHKGLQRTANEYAEERRIYKGLISKNNNVDILDSASRSVDFNVVR